MVRLKLTTAAAWRLIRLAVCTTYCLWLGKPVYKLRLGQAMNNLWLSKTIKRFWLGQTDASLWLA